MQRDRQAGEVPAQGSETSEFFNGLHPGLGGGEVFGDAKAGHGGGVARCSGFTGWGSVGGGPRAVGWASQAPGFLSGSLTTAARAPALGWRWGGCETPAGGPPAGCALRAPSSGTFEGAALGSRAVEGQGTRPCGWSELGHMHWVRGSPPPTRSPPRGGPGRGRTGCRPPGGGGDMCPEGEAEDLFPRRPSYLPDIM